MNQELSSIRYPAFSQTNLTHFLKEIENEAQEIIQDTHQALKNLKQNNLSCDDPTNTDYLYSLAEAGTWKTMMDYKGFKLPGTLDEYQTCGKFRYVMCPTDNFVRRIRHSCHRLGCPVCVRSAGKRAGKKIQRRVWLYGLMVRKLSNSRRNPLPSHIIESIPANDIFWSWSKSKQNRILNEMRRIAGITAGAEITHLWRFREGKTEPYLGIHNHLIAFGWVNQDASKQIKEQFGVDVIYHKVKDGTLRKREDVFLVSYYLLSHCAIKNNKHSLRWFGDLSYRKIKNSYLKQFRDEQFLEEDNDIEKSKSCKICNEKLIPAKINKKHSHWNSFIPPPNELEDGCIVVSGLFQSLDFFTEKMIFYGHDHDEIYHKTRRELELERQERNPLVYNRVTNSMTLENFIIIRK